MTLYHATYLPRLASIMTGGLRPDTEKNWSISEDYIYLTDDPEVAISFAEIAEEVPEEYLNQIVVLKVDAKDLDLDKLELDDNIIEKNDYSFQYSGHIPPEIIEVEDIDFIDFEDLEEFEEQLKIR